MDSFDYVIVGAGAAGCVLANRLTQDRVTSVCILEAGGKDSHPFIKMPAGFVKTLYADTFVWPFKTEPSASLGGRQVAVPQGKVIGGSSSINGMVYNRGQRVDFDTWAQFGNRGWSYDDLLPYFKRSEQRIGAGDDQYRGREGELPITDVDWILYDRNAESLTGDDIGTFRARLIDRGWQVVARDDEAGIDIYQFTGIVAGPATGVDEIPEIPEIAAPDQEEEGPDG